MICILKVYLPRYHLETAKNGFKESFYKAFLYWIISPSFICFIKKLVKKNPHFSTAFPKTRNPGFENPIHHEIGNTTGIQSCFIITTNIDFLGTYKNIVLTPRVVEA